MPLNEIILGDNLCVLTEDIKKESVDLCYIDPPFNTNRNFAKTNGEHYYRSGGSFDETVFGDIFKWDTEAEAAYHSIMKNEGGKFTEETIGFISYLLTAKGEARDLSYFVFMCVRLNAIWHVLKPTASFYLHCDLRMNYYLRMLLDTIFLPRNGKFRNEIAWKRTFSHNNVKKNYGKLYDTIIYYSKSSSFYFNPVYLPHKEGYLKDNFRHNDKEGSYQYESITGGVLNPNDKAWRGYDPRQIDRHWAVPKRLVHRLVGEEAAKKLSIVERLELLYEKGYIVFSKNGTPRYKSHLKYLSGSVLQNIWTDVQIASLSERTGYPTQKPKKLLERIIKVSSKVGDVVLDPFCGSGTTCFVAKSMDRQYIGIDKSEKAVLESRERCGEGKLTQISL